MTIELHPNHLADRDPRLHKRRSRALLRRFALAAFLLMIIGAVVVFLLMQTEPHYWEDNQAFLHNHTPEEINAIADRLEARILGVLMAHDANASRVRDTNMPQIPGEGPDTRTVFMTTEEVNAWMAKRLHAWARYQGYLVPEQFQDPMVAIDDGHLTFAFRYASPGWSQVFSGRLYASFDDTNHAKLRIKRVRAGEMPIPPGGIGLYIRHHMGNDVESGSNADWFDKVDEIDFNPKFKSQSRQRVWLKGYTVRDGGIYLVLKIDPRDAPERPGSKPTLATAPDE